MLVHEFLKEGVWINDDTAKDIHGEHCDASSDYAVQFDVIAAVQKCYSAVEAEKVLKRIQWGIGIEGDTIEVLIEWQEKLTWDTLHSFLVNLNI